MDLVPRRALQPKRQAQPLEFAEPKRTLDLAPRRALEVSTKRPLDLQRQPLNLAPQPNRAFLPALQRLGVRAAGPASVFLAVADGLQAIQDNFNPIEQLRRSQGLSAPNDASGQASPSTLLPATRGADSELNLSPLSVNSNGFLFITKNEPRFPSGQFSFAFVNDNQPSNFTFSSTVINAGFGDVYWGLRVFRNGVEIFTDGRALFSFGGTITDIQFVPLSGQPVQYQGSPGFSGVADQTTSKAAPSLPELTPAPLRAIAPASVSQPPPQQQQTQETDPAIRQALQNLGVLTALPELTRSPQQQTQTQSQSGLAPKPAPEGATSVSDLLEQFAPAPAPAIDPITLRFREESPQFSPAGQGAIPTVGVLIAQLLAEVASRLPQPQTQTQPVFQTPPRRPEECLSEEDKDQLRCKFSDCASVTLCEPERSWLERAGGIVYSGSRNFPACEKLQPGSEILQTSWEDFGPQAILEAIQSQNQAIDRLMVWVCKLADQEPSLAVPEWWPIVRAPQIRQMVIAYRPRNPDGSLGPANRQITIPHYFGNGQPFAPVYTSGPFYAIAKLSDNSKIHVYGSTDQEARRVCEIMLSQTDPAFSSAAIIRSGRVSGKEVEVAQRVPYKWILWPQGQEAGLAQDSGFF